LVFTKKKEQVVVDCFDSVHKNQNFFLFILYITNQARKIHKTHRFRKTPRRKYDFYPAPGLRRSGIELKQTHK